MAAFMVVVDTVAVAIDSAVVDSMAVVDLAAVDSMAVVEADAAGSTIPRNAIEGSMRAARAGDCQRLGVPRQFWR
jgi:hypothetical protein